MRILEGEEAGLAPGGAESVDAITAHEATPNNMTTTPPPRVRRTMGEHAHSPVSPYSHSPRRRPSGLSMHHGGAGVDTALPPSPLSRPADRPASPMGPPPAPLHRLSITSTTAARSRRPSQLSLLHEIQPPVRRLSAHQVMILTPFGGPLPPSLGAQRGSDASSTASSMRRESSGMARGGATGGRRNTNDRERMSFSSTYSYTASSGLSSSPTGAASFDSAPAAGAMVRENSSMATGPSRHGGTPPQQAGRARQLSLAGSNGLGPVGPSPLSAQMTTISSASDQASAGSAQPSRDASQERWHEDDHHDAVDEDVVPLTVPMTRSNSLPVLTLRELQALKDKDGELGINRGGDWAWVSRDHEDDSGDYPLAAVGPSPESAGSAGSLPSGPTFPSISSSQPAWSGFTFADPFAPSAAPIAGPSSTGGGFGGVGMGREANLFPQQYRPVSTTEGYHYSPKFYDRRQSETPELHALRAQALAQGSGEASGSGDASRDKSGTEPRGSGRNHHHHKVHDPHRRPSVPFIGASGPSSLLPRRGSGLRASQTARPAAVIEQADRTPQQASAAELLAPPAVAPAADESEWVAPPLSPSRPRLLRYKTSPARHTALGLNIVVRPSAASSPATKSPRSGPASAASASAVQGQTGGSTPDEFGMAGGYGPHATRSLNDSSRRRTRVAGSGTGSGVSRGSLGYARPLGGTWTPVDIIDSLQADLGLSDFGPVRPSGPSGADTSPASASHSLPRRGVYRQNLADGAIAPPPLLRAPQSAGLVHPPAPISAPVLILDRPTSMPPMDAGRRGSFSVLLPSGPPSSAVSDFAPDWNPSGGRTGQSRGRFDSVDSAFPHSSSSSSLFDASDAFATLGGVAAAAASTKPAFKFGHYSWGRKPVLPRWSSSSSIQTGPGGEDTPGFLDGGARSRLGLPSAAHWSDRRGSWGEGMDQR